MTFYAVYYIVYVVEQMLGRKRETNIFQMPKQEKSIKKQSRKIQRFYESCMAPKGTFPDDLKIGQRPESPLLFSGENNHFTSKQFCGFITFESSPHDLTFVG